MGNPADPNSVPEESVVMTDSSFAGSPPTPPTPSPTASGTTTSIPAIKNKGNTGKIVATIFGLLLLIGGVGAGLVLVNQQQLIDQNAQVPPCTVTYNGNSFTLAGDCGSVPVQRFNGASCPTTDNPEQVHFPGAGTYTGTPSNTACQQVDYLQTVGGVPAGGVCSCGGSGTPTPRKAYCGDACTQDSDCEVTTSGGVQPVCNPTTRLCVNPACPTDTDPGSICTCGSANVRTCGQTCGQQKDGSNPSFNCGPNAICGNSAATGGDGNNYCLPTNNPDYLTKGGTCGKDPNPGLYCIKKVDGTVVNTQAGIIAACNLISDSANCGAVKAYDTNWNLLTPTQLSALSVGSIVRFTVTGTATSGNFDRARFTINGTLRPEVTSVKPATTGEFYDEYTVPAGVTSFTVTSQIHHQQLNQWF